MAAKEDKPGRVVIETWEEFEPRVRRFMGSYAFDLKRQIVFGFDESPKEDDDVFRDETGPNGLQFLLWRAEKRQIGKTVAVFTGSINGGEYKQELAHIWSKISTRAERTYMKHTLTTIMRNTKHIASYWMKESGINSPVGHNFDGEPVVYKKFLLVSQVLEEVAETLRNLLFVHKVSRRSIAIIGPRRQEVKKILKYLKPLFPGNEKDRDRLDFRSAKKFAEGENAVTVDVYSSVLSQEWVFIIAFSLTCADFMENFRVTAFSRAICRLFYFERNYSDIQNNIAQAFNSKVKNMLEYPAMRKLVNNGIKRIGPDLKESDSNAIYVHQSLTALREDYIAGTGVFILDDCDTFSKCLQYVMLNNKRLRSFVFEMNSTEQAIGAIKYRMQWSHNRKPKLVVLKRQKFFERALQIDENSDLGKIYLEFCNLRCEVVLDFYNERKNGTYQKPAPFGMKKNRDFERVVYAANMLVKSQCSLRFEPI